MKGSPMAKIVIGVILAAALSAGMFPLLAEAGDT